jgi:hypothetical protein
MAAITVTGDMVMVMDMVTDITPITTRRIKNPAFCNACSENPEIKRNRQDIGNRQN